MFWHICHYVEMNLRNRLSVVVVICHNLWTTLLINELVLTRIDIILQSEKMLGEILHN